MTMASRKLIISSAVEDPERDAKEIFFVMHSEVKVPRNVRVNWFFEHMGANVRLSENFHSSDGLTIVGMHPFGERKEAATELRVSRKTTLTYFSYSYRMVFVIDVSLSSFATDKHGNVFFNRAIESVISCMENVVKSFKFPGGRILFRPKIYATFCVSSSFLHFSGDNVLFQGVLLNDESISVVIANLRKKYECFVSDLCSYIQPLVKEWSKNRRKFREFASEIEVAIYNEKPFCDLHSTKSVPQPENRLENAANVADFVSKHKNEMCSSANGSSAAVGLVSAEWSMTSMIRAGILAVQMLPDNTHSNLVIVSDGVAVLSDDEALERLVQQMRSLSISFSFIHLTSGRKGATLGHSECPQLFKYLCDATSGQYLHERERVSESPNMNIYHRAFLSWTFQKPQLTANVACERLFDAFWNSTSSGCRNRHSSRTFTMSFHKLLYIRMREGCVVKDIHIYERNMRTFIRLTMSLLWRPSVNLEYVVTAVWNGDLEASVTMNVEMFVESTNDCRLLYGAELNSLERNDGTTIDLLMENFVAMDELIVHLHTFNSTPQFYKLNDELALEKQPLFELNRGELVVATRYRQKQLRHFLQFWFSVCSLGDDLWRKWVHTHTLRLILTEDQPISPRIFTKSEETDEFVQITCSVAGRKVMDVLRNHATFVLIRERCFVTLVYEEDKSEVPYSFYITRVQYDSPCMIIRLAFAGATHSSIRAEIIRRLREELMSIKVKQTNLSLAKTTAFTADSVELPQLSRIVQKVRRVESINALHQFQRPLERILIRYTQMPTEVSQIIRVEEGRLPKEIREIIIHNTLAKYLSCRRYVWEMRPVFPKLRIVFNNCTEFILQVILKRRLRQGFSIAYGYNGIVNLIRQVETSRSGLPRVQQCIIFGPVMTDTSLPPPSIQYDKEDFNSVLNAAPLEPSTEIPAEIPTSNEEQQPPAVPDYPNSEPPFAFPRMGTEVWLEPHGCLDDRLRPDESLSDHHLPNDFYNAESTVTREELLKESDAIVRSIFTFDQMMRAAESGYYADDPHVLNRVASIMSKKALSDSVDAFHDIFDPKALMDNADSREFMLLPALGFSDEGQNDEHVDVRLESLLKFLQAELTSYADCCVDALDDAFLWDIVENCEEHFGINRFYSPDLIDSDRVLDSANNYLIQDAGERERLRKDLHANDSSGQSTCSDLTVSDVTTAYRNSPDEDSRPVSPGTGAADEEAALTTDTQSGGEGEETTFIIGPIRSDRTERLKFGSATIRALTSLETELNRRNHRAPSVAGAELSIMATLEDEDISEPNIKKVDDEGEDAAHRSLLEAYDSAIALSSSALQDGISQSNRKQSGDKSRNASGSGGERLSKKLSKDERSRNASGSAKLSDSARVEKAKKAYEEKMSKNEEKGNALKKYPPIPLGGFGLYIRRLGAHRLVIFAVPKNAKTVRLLMPHSMSAFPVFAYYVDKLRMVQRFVEKGYSDVHEIRTIVQDFTQKARKSTLALLSQQIHDMVVDECSSETDQTEGVPLDQFYLRALPSDHIRLQMSKFDLRSYSERVFEEFIFTRAFVAAAYISIGQQVYVPHKALEELTEKRCDHSSLELGSIYPLVQDSCVHLALYELQNEMLDPNCDVEFGNLRSVDNPDSDSAFSSNPLTPAEFFTDPLAECPQLPPNLQKLTRPQRFFLYPNGCQSTFTDFRAAFRRMLRLQSFKPVPGVDDCYFYWPYQKAVLLFPTINDVSAEFANVFRAIGDNMASRQDKGMVQIAASDIWPLFIQFSVTFIGSRQTDITMGNIPTCLKTLADACPPGVLNADPSTVSNRPKIAVDLYVLTWPLPKDCPFKVVDPDITASRFHDEQLEISLRGIYAETERQRRKYPKSERSASTKTTESEETEDDGLPDHYIEDEDEGLVTADDMAEREVEFDKEMEFQMALNERTEDAKATAAEDVQKKCGFFFQFPRLELSAIALLQKGIKQIFSLEELMSLSRQCELPPPNPQPSSRLLAVVCNTAFMFASPNLTAPFASTISTEAIFYSAHHELTLIGNVDAAVSELSDRLDDFTVDYIRFRRFDPEFGNIVDGNEETLPAEPIFPLTQHNTTYGYRSSVSHEPPMLFYACGVEEEMIEEFEQTYIDYMLNRVKTVPQKPVRRTVSCDNLFEEILRDGDRRTRPRSNSVSSLDSNETESENGDLIIDLVEPLNDLADEQRAMNAIEGEEEEADITETITIEKKPQIRRRRHHSDSAIPRNAVIHFEPGCPQASGEVDEEVHMAAMEEKTEQSEVVDEWLQRFGVQSADESIRWARKREKLMHDFWIVVHIERSLRPKMGIYFIRRYNTPHDPLMMKTLRTIESQVRIVNQKLLLLKMHETEECDQLLLDEPESRRPVQFPHPSRYGRPLSSIIRMPLDPSKIVDLESFSDIPSEMMLDMRFRYPPGHFVCDVLWYHWFEIHPRLRPPNSRFHSGSVDLGFKTLHLALEKFSVRNRPNLYVYKEHNGNVVYIRLYQNDETPLRELKSRWITNRPSTPRFSRLGTHVLMTVHGIQYPGKEITEELKTMLQRRLDAKTLNEIQNILTKNEQARLDPRDAQFLQRNPQEPDAVFHFAIPNQVGGYLRSLLYYLEQHIRNFCIEPHIRQHSGGPSSGLNTPRLKHPSDASSSAHSSPHSATLLSPSNGSSFVSFSAPGTPRNPPAYVPMFFLLNRPSDRGRRNVGLICIELKMFDTEFQLVTKFSPNEVNFGQNLRRLLAVPESMNFQRRMKRLHELTKTPRVKNPGACSRKNISGFVSVNFWQNGQMELSEMESQFRWCLQLAIYDLFTEFGLLSIPLLERHLGGPLSSVTPSFSDSSESPSSSGGMLLKRQNAEDGNTRRRPLSGHTNNSTESRNPNENESFNAEETAITNKIRANIQLELDETRKTPSPVTTTSTPTPAAAANGPVLSSAAMGVYGFFEYEDNMTPPGSIHRNRDSTESAAIDVVSPRPPPTSASVAPSSVSSSKPWDEGAAASAALQNLRGRAPSMGSSITPQLATILSSRRHKSGGQILSLATRNQLSSPTPPLPMKRQSGGTPIRHSSTAPSPLSPQPPSADWLHSDYTAAASDWFDFVASALKEREPLSAQNSNSPFRRFVHMLDCDGASRKILQVIYEQLIRTFPSERFAVCKGSPPTPNGGESIEFAFPPADSAKRLKALSSVDILLAPIVQDYGRIVDEEEEVEIALVGFCESEFAASVRELSSIGPSRQLPDALQSLLTPNSASAQLQSLLPNREPFIPRQRLMFVIPKGEVITLYLYNYSAAICEQIRQLVERAVLWHNARSRLIREIGLHKLGITHLSTLKTDSAKYNSYLLLTWLDPETLVLNDYPPTNLITPDFSKIPRKYAQLLLKLYRFSESAFVAKNFSLDPFVDQTQQMLTLRHDVRAKLNDHRLFIKVHSDLQEGKAEITEEELNVLAAHSHHAHYVQSPLLLFTTWRFRIAVIRQNLASNADSFGTTADGGISPAIISAKSPPQRPKRLSPQNPMGKEDLSMEAPPPSPGRTPAPNLKPRFFSGASTQKTRSKTISSSSRKSSKDEIRSLSSIGSTSLHGTVHSRNIPEPELCLLKVQYMLATDYIAYLQQIGLTLLKITCAANPQAYNLQYSPDCSIPPNVWLYAARAGGIIFAHVTFIEPYFSVKFLFWNASQLNDHILVNDAMSPDVWEEMRQIELLKNELIQRSHVHSFTYDFHLRMVSKFLSGGNEVLFNPGYNTKDFLVDFLSYYGCRPPCARNCIYAEGVTEIGLYVPGSTIWEYFLTNNLHFGWTVVRMKTHRQADEYVLMSKENREISGQKYKLISIILHEQRSSSAAEQENQLHLKLYVVMVSEANTHPLPDNITSKRRTDSGDNKADMSGESSTTSSTTTIRAKDHTCSGSNSTASGGEFTCVETGPRISSAANFNDSQKSVLGVPSYGRNNAEEYNDQLLDELIAMSTDELMYDVGIQKKYRPTQRKSEEIETTSKQRRHQSGDPTFFRRRCSSGDTQSMIAGVFDTDKETTGNGRRLSGSPTVGRASSQNSRHPNNDDRTSNRQLRRSLSRINFNKRLDDVWKDRPMENAEEADVNFKQVDGDTKLAIGQDPPRRHGQAVTQFLKRKTDAILQPEQVTYVHYFSNQQRRLQHLLEESTNVKKCELSAFIHEANRLCYSDIIWKSILNGKIGTSKLRTNTGLFSASKTESAESSGNTAPASDDEQQKLENLFLLGLVERIPIEFEEPRVIKLLERLNFVNLCRAVTRFYDNKEGNKEADKMYRFIECGNQRHLLLINQSYEECALIISETKPLGAEMQRIFKIVPDNRVRRQPHNLHAIHLQFNEVMNVITTFLWSEISQPSSL